MCAFSCFLVFVCVCAHTYIYICVRVPFLIHIVCRLEPEYWQQEEVARNGFHTNYIILFIVQGDPNTSPVDYIFIGFFSIFSLDSTYLSGRFFIIFPFYFLLYTYVFLCTPCFFYPSADNLTIDKSCLNTRLDKLKRNMRKYILCCRMYIYSRWFYVIW